MYKLIYHFLSFVLFLTLFVVACSSLADDQSKRNNIKYYFSTYEEKLAAISGENAFTLSNGQECSGPGSCIAEAGTLLMLSGRPDNLWIPTYDSNQFCERIARGINKPLKANSFNNDSIETQHPSIKYLFNISNVPIIGTLDAKIINSDFSRHKISNEKLFGTANANSHIRDLMSDNRFEESYIYLYSYISLSEYNTKFKKIVFSLAWQDLSLTKKKFEFIEPIYIFNGEENEFLSYIEDDISKVFDKSVLLSYDNVINNVIFDHNNELYPNNDLNMYDASNTYFLILEDDIFFIENVTIGRDGFSDREGFRFLSLDEERPGLITPRILVSTITKNEINFDKKIHCEFISRLSLWNATVAYRSGDTFLYYLKTKEP